VPVVITLKTPPPFISLPKFGAKEIDAGTLYVCLVLYCTIVPYDSVHPRSAGSGREARFPEMGNDPNGLQNYHTTTSFSRGDRGKTFDKAIAFFPKLIIGSPLGVKVVKNFDVS